MKGIFEAPALEEVDLRDCPVSDKVEKLADDGKLCCPSLKILNGKHLTESQAGKVSNPMKDLPTVKSISSSRKKNEEPEDSSKLKEEIKSNIEQFSKKNEIEVKKSVTHLSDLHLTFSDQNSFKEENGSIVHCGKKEIETCLIGDLMSHGVYRLTVRRIGDPLTCYGVINSDLGCPESGKSISKANKGVMIRDSDYIDNIFSINHQFIGSVIDIRDQDIVILELDLRSEEVEKRTLHFYVRGNQQKTYVYGIPKNVQFGICLKEPGSELQFISLEELKEPGYSSVFGEKARDWNSDGLNDKGGDDSELEYGRTVSSRLSRVSTNVSNKDKNIVIDVGSFLIKSGFAGDYLPKSVIPSALSVPKSQPSKETDNESGDGALPENPLDLTIDRGEIVNWEGLETILTFVIRTELHSKAEDKPVLFGVNPHTSNKLKERLLEFMFESEKVGMFNIQNTSFLSLCSIGKTKGVVIDSGEGGTSIVPIYDRHCAYDDFGYLNLGGLDITKSLAEKYSPYNISGYGYHEWFNFIRDMKEKQFYVSSDYEQDCRDADHPIDKIINHYTLPDCSVIKVGRDCFVYPECLFDPAILGVEGKGIHEMVGDVVGKWESDVQRELYSNILLTGGNTMFTGFDERLAKELRKVAPEGVNVNIEAPSIREYSAFVGGSVFASLSTFMTYSYTKFEYEEFGENIMYKKLKYYG